MLTRPMSQRRQRSRPTAAQRKPLGLLISSLAACTALTATTVHGQTVPNQATALAPMVVTGARSPQSSLDTITDIDVLVTDGLRPGSALSTADQLDTLSGVELVRSGSAGSATTILLRGSTAGQTLLLIDGFRISSGSLGQPTYEAIPMGLTDRIEVLRGPASGLYGADAIGGVIQLFTPNARPGLRYGGEYSTGSQNTHQTTGSISGGSQTISGGLRLTRDQSDGFDAKRAGSFGANPDDDGYTRTGVVGHINAQLSSTSHLRGVYLRNDLKSDFDDGGFENAQVKTRNELIGLTSETEISPADTLTLKVGRTIDRSVSESSFPSTFETTQDQLQAVLNHGFSDSLNLQFSLERLNQQVDTQSYTPVAKVERTTNSAGVALFGREGAHLLRANLRYDDNDEYGDQVSGTLSYGYAFSQTVRAGGAYSTGFRAPNFNALYFPGFGRPGIRPERSRNVELGVYFDQRSRAKPNGWHTKAVLFDNRVKDLIVFAPVCPDPDPQFGFGCADNVNTARIKGLSLTAGHTAGAVSWSASADFLDPKDAATGNRLARRATRQLKASVTYQIDRTSITGAFKVAGSRFDDANNTNRLPGYGTVNLRATYELAKQWNAFVDIINLADKDYELAGGFNSQPRALMVGVRFDSF